MTFEDWFDMSDMSRCCWFLGPDPGAWTRTAPYSALSPERQLCVNIMGVS